MTDDADPTLAPAKERGGSLVLGPDDVDGIGQFGVVKDATGAKLAMMKPAPMENPAKP